MAQTGIVKVYVMRQPVTEDSDGKLHGVQPAQHMSCAVVELDSELSPGDWAGFGDYVHKALRFLGVGCAEEGTKP